MSQGSVQVSTTPPLPGATAVSQINTALAAVISKFSASTSPTLGPGASNTLVAGQDWLNTSTSPYVLNMYDGAQWCPWFTINPSTHTTSMYLGPNNAAADAPLTVSSNDGQPAAPSSGCMIHAVGGNGGTPNIQIDAYSGVPQVNFRFAANTRASPQHAAANSSLGNFAWFAYGSTAYSSASRVRCRAAAEEDWTDTAQGARFEVATTPAGGTATAFIFSVWGSGGVSIGSGGADPGAGCLQIKGTTASTSTTTGAATIGGGLGVAGALFAGSVNVSVDRTVLFTNQTSSAAANTGTLTNAPAAGNPTFWLRTKINGSNFAIPCWAG